ncbi:hypothetical protein [Ruegeria atlantica]|uniref:hypothetical protein n=1 Tax=Ruegeria atlantica TaxID=81569 RepID=UPI001480D897|nr:hypothetical protein [Ruegeria atlantica]
MEKTLITSVTAFALILNAGTSMAGPRNGHGPRAQAHDVRSTVSQAFHSDGKGNMIDVKPHASITQLQGTTSTAGSSGAPSIVSKECSDLWANGNKGTECDITIDVHYVDVPEFSFDRTNLRNVLDIDAGTVVKHMVR